MRLRNKDRPNLTNKLNLNAKSTTQNKSVTQYKSSPTPKNKTIAGGRTGIRKRVIETKKTNDSSLLKARSDSLNKSPARTKTCANKKDCNKLSVRCVDSNQNVPSSIRKDLRKRKRKNYAEVSQCSLSSCCDKSVNKNKTGEHIPIYLKQEVATKPNKRLKDPFEFVPETPKRKRQGNLKDHKNSFESDGDSILYDKNTHDILKRLKVREAKIKAKLNTNKLAKNKLLETKSQGTKNVINKADACKNVQFRPVLTDIKNINVPRSNQTKKTIKELNTSNDDISCCFGFDDDSEEDEIPVFRGAGSTAGSRGTNMILKPIKPINKDAVGDFVALTSTPVVKRQGTNRKTNLDKNETRVHIISNITLPPQSREPQNRNFQNLLDKHKQIQPDYSIISQRQGFPTFRQSVLSSATSTPVQTFGGSLPHEEDSPWRSDCLNVTRNPHFLALKNSLLPSYNQEMVLEPKLLERPNITQTPQRNEKSLLQSSMLEFINNSQSKSNTPTTKALIERSLFDNGDFSPIRQSKRDKTPAKSPAKVKRNILGILKPSNKENLPNAGEAYNVNNYFGFDSFNDDEENKENRIKPNRPKNKVRIEAHPTRISITEAKNLQQDIVNDILEDMDYVDAREQDFPKERPSDEPQVALFEDLEVVKKPRRSYERKRARRVRVKSFDSEVSEEIKPKVKRKDMRTPQEEEEFNKWVTQFNAMCEEVENYTLETD